MAGSKAPVYVVVKGFAASMTAVIATLAERSYCYPNTIILHHQVSNTLRGNMTVLKEQVDFTNRWFERFGTPVAKKMGLPPLAVGIGIYLPMSATFAVVVGAVIGHWYNLRAARAAQPARAERLGTLVASGLIVGESLFGVLNAGLIVLMLIPATRIVVSLADAVIRKDSLLGFATLFVTILLTLQILGVFDRLLQQS